MESYLFTEAVFFANNKHRGQFRDGGDAYIEHVMTVAMAVEIYTQDEEVLAAAVLHDTIEDTDTTYEELAEKFGKRVADLVKEVTKEGYNLFPNLETPEGVLIKLCDRAHNISTMQIWPKEKQQEYINKTTFWLTTPQENNVAGCCIGKAGAIILDPWNDKLHTQLCIVKEIDFLGCINPEKIFPSGLTYQERKEQLQALLTEE